MSWGYDRVLMGGYEGVYDMSWGYDRVLMGEYEDVYVVLLPDLLSACFLATYAGSLATISGGLPPIPPLPNRQNRQ